MNWVTIYRVGASAPGGISAVSAWKFVPVLVLLGVLVVMILRRPARPSSRLGSWFAGVVGCAVVGIVASQLYAQHVKQGRLAALLNAGQVQRAQGPVSDVLVVNPNKALVIFTVQG